MFFETFRVCLIGTNSESGRFGRFGRPAEPSAPKGRRFGRPAEPSAPKGRRFGLGTVFPSLQSLPFSEFGRFGITNNFEKQQVASSAMASC